MSKLTKILTDYSINLHAYANGNGNADDFINETDKAEKAIEAYILERELKAVRKDRLANTRFWKEKLDKIFNHEIAVYEKQQKESAE